MRDTELFQAALGLPSPWIVLRSEFDPDQKQLDLHIGFARGSRFACPACGAEGCGVHDVREKEWRHLNFFQHKTVLKASIPRVSRADAARLGAWGCRPFAIGAKSLAIMTP